MSVKKILVVEDDPAIRRVIAIALKSEGHAVDECANGADALATAYELRPDIVLLDVMLPGKDGLAVCRELRANPETRAIPIVMLTAKGEESDIVAGLDAGADDYVTKPFSKVVLLARIRAALRRENGRTEDRLSIDGLVLDESRHDVTRNGETLRLTLTEYNILNLLMRHPGRVFGRAQIIGLISDGEKIVTERTIDVQMVGLRRKLGPWADHIETIRGVGYRLEVDETKA